MFIIDYGYYYKMLVGSVRRAIEFDEEFKSKFVRQCIHTSYTKSMPSSNMQALQSTHKIEEDVKNDALLSIVSDKYCRSILEAIMDMPKSVIEIASEKKIPISTVYRRIQTLHDNKLVQTSGTITDEGKRLFLYKSKIKGIKSKFESGNLGVELIFN